MASPRAIRGALRGFLGTYTSRYSAFDGYWLFGFIVECGERFHIDLMSSEVVADEPAPLATARVLAHRKFQEQLAKNGVAASVVSASLLIEVAPEGVPAQPHWRGARPVRFTVEARSRTGANVVERVVVHVAAHDPRVELRSAITAGR